MIGQRKAARVPKQEERYEQNCKHGLEVIGASLAFAAVICLLIGGWHDLSVGYSGMKKRLARKFGSEYDDYADEELYE